MHTHKLIKVKRNFQRQTDTWRHILGHKEKQKKRESKSKRLGKNRDRKSDGEAERFRDEEKTASEACSEIDSLGGSMIHILLLQWEFQNLQWDTEFAYGG